MKRTLSVLVFLLACQSTDDEHVGSRDCAVILDATRDPATADACATCQAQTCGAISACADYPCENQKVVIQGCEEDEDCTSLGQGMRCGMFSAPDKICSSHPDDI